MKKIWNYKKISRSEAERLAQEYGVNILLAKVLLARGFSQRESIEFFINGGRDFYDPFMMKDMERAVERICTALDEKQPITIFGDYDADGITSVACLYSFLRRLGARVDYYIPDRLTEGYGMSVEALEEILDQGARLIVTVDCGISSHQEASYLKEKGIDLVVTDHHECSSMIPEAYAVVNPKRPDCPYPYKELAGVGVVFKLIHAICKKKDLGDIYKDYSDIAAVGTISDVVPLLDENRLLVREGLEKLKNTQNIGLKELLSVAGLNREKLNSFSVAFAITPRINAGGRMGAAELALDLLLTEDEQQARQLAEEINQNNRNRQNLEQEIYERLVKIIEDKPEYKGKNVLVMAEEGLHHGVIGIAASRISDRYYKPCVIMSLDRDEEGTLLAKGSCRSIKGFNIYEALTSCSDLLIKYGGHELAAGLTMKPENIPDLDSRLNEIAREMDPAVFVPALSCDTCIDETDITVENIKALKALEPYGQNNPVPSFVLEGATLLTARTVGAENQHIKMLFQKNQHTIDSIAFNAYKEGLTLEVNSVYDIMFTLDINEWNNTVRPQVKIIDIRKSLGDRKLVVDALDLAQVIELGRKELLQKGVNEARDKIRNMARSLLTEGINSNREYFTRHLADRDDMAVVYKYMYARGKINSKVTVSDIARDLNISKLKARLVLEAFQELDLAEGDFDRGCCLKNNLGKKVELDSSLTYRVMTLIKEVL